MRTIKWQTKLIVFTICIFFTSASYTMCVPFLPVYLLELGTPESQIEFWSALVFSSCFLIAGIMAPIWGKISDIKGKKSMALRSSILLCLSYASGGIVTSPLQLLGTRILQGFANGYLPVILSIVSEGSPREKLGTSLSFIQSAQLIGTVSGPLIGGSLANIFGYRASFIIAGCCLALVVVITFIVPEDKKTTVTATSDTTIIQDLKFCFSDRIIRELMLMLALFSMVMLAVQPLLSLFVAELIGGYADVAFYAGLACSLPPMVGALAAPFWGYLGQKRGYYRVMAVTLVGAGIFLAIQSMAQNYLMLMIMSGVMGIFIVGITPALNASITLATPDDFKGRAFGALTMTGQLGCMCGPFLGALVAHLFAIRYQFLVSGSMLILMGAYFVVRYTQLRRQQKSEALNALTGEGRIINLNTIPEAELAQEKAKVRVNAQAQAETEPVVSITSASSGASAASAAPAASDESAAAVDAAVLTSSAAKKAAVDAAENGSADTKK